MHMSTTGEYDLSALAAKAAAEKAKLQPKKSGRVRKVVVGAAIFAASLVAGAVISVRITHRYCGPGDHHPAAAHGAGQK